jgi:hypothetical protein
MLFLMKEAIDSPAAEDVFNGIRDFAHEQVENWSEQCARLRRWERRELLDKEPSQLTLARHAELLRSFIKNTDSLIGVAATDDIYDAGLRERLAIIRERLQDSEDMYHPKITAEEADRILAEAFPDGR